MSEAKFTCFKISKKRKFEQTCSEVRRRIFRCLPVSCDGARQILHSHIYLLFIVQQFGRFCPNYDILNNYKECPLF
jgi:hypothetical protein